MSTPGYQIGHDNREAVRTYFLTHVGVTNREVASALGLSEIAVGRHVKTLREEWLCAQAASPHHVPTGAPDDLKSSPSYMAGTEGVVGSGAEESTGPINYQTDDLAAEDDRRHREWWRGSAS